MIKQLLIALLFASLCRADGQVIGWPAAGGGTYYYSAGSDSYPNSDGDADTGDSYGAAITAGATGNITTIGVKVATKGTSNFKIMIITPGGAVHECQTISNASVTNGAWTDVTLSTPLAVTSSQVVRIWVTVDATGQTLFNYAAGSSGLLFRSDVYADFCSNSATGSGVGFGPVAVRIKI